MTRDSSRPSPDADPDPRLVAYLDGELPPEEAGPVEAWIARSPDARAEVHRLQRVWQLLDHLPDPSPSISIADRTLEALRLDLDAEEPPRPRRPMGNWPVYGHTLALVGAVAFGITRRGTNTSARATSPPAAPGRSEDTEALQAVGSWEFLVALDRSGAFPEDEP